MCAVHVHFFMVLVCFFATPRVAKAAVRFDAIQRAADMLTTLQQQRNHCRKDIKKLHRLCKRWMGTLYALDVQRIQVLVDPSLSQVVELQMLVVTGRIKRLLSNIKDLEATYHDLVVWCATLQANLSAAKRTFDLYQAPHDSTYPSLRHAK